MKVVKESFILIATITIVFLLFLLLEKSNNQPKEKEIKKEIKVIEKIIRDTTERIVKIEQRISKVKLNSLENRIDSLIKVKENAKDTVVIIRVLEKITTEQKTEIDTLKYLNKNCDSINNIQKFIITKKDSVNLKLKEINKKQKKISVKRIAKGIITGVITGGATVIALDRNK